MSFRFADWNPTRGTVPAYLCDTGTDQITLGEVIVIDGAPCDASGSPLTDDGTTRTLQGWRHGECASFSRGTVLVPLKGSRVA